MKLSELLSKHSSIVLLNENDNQKILDFFRDSPMKGEKIELSYDRSPDFFQLLKFQSNDYYVFAYQENDKILAIGTLLIRSGYVGEILQNVGYLGDLRVKNNRHAQLAWRDFYDDLMVHFENIEEFKNTKYLYTVVIDSNKAAKRALVAQSKQKFQYHLVSKYKMINIFQLVPFQFQRSGNFTFQNFNEVEENEIKSFLKSNHQKTIFGLNEDDIISRIKNWPSLQQDQIFVIKRNGVIVAFTYLWSPTPYKKIIVQKFPNVFLIVMNMMLSKKLRLKNEFKVLYLNSLTIDKNLSKSEIKQVLHLILHRAFSHKLKKDFHSIAFADFEYNNYFELLPLSLSNQTPMAMYQVLLRKKFDDLALPTEKESFFEMSLV